MFSLVQQYGMLLTGFEPVLQAVIEQYRQEAVTLAIAVEQREEMQPLARDGSIAGLLAKLLILEKVIVDPAFLQQQPQDHNALNRKQELLRDLRNQVASRQATGQERAVPSAASDTGEVGAALDQQLNEGTGAAGSAPTRTCLKVSTLDVNPWCGPEKHIVSNVCICMTCIYMMYRHDV
jgi:hypothetical protein